MPYQIRKGGRDGEGDSAPMLTVSTLNGLKNQNEASAHSWSTNSFFLFKSRRRVRPASCSSRCDEELRWIFKAKICRRPSPQMFHLAAFGFDQEEKKLGCGGKIKTLFFNLYLLLIQIKSTPLPSAPRTNTHTHTHSGKQRAAASSTTQVAAY